MHPAILQVLMNRPIIPSSCRPSLLMMQHGAKRGSVSYSLTNLVSNGDFSNGTTGWTTSNCGINNVANEGVSLATAFTGRAIYKVPIAANNAYFAIITIKGDTNSNAIAVGDDTSYGYNATTYTAIGNYQKLPIVILQSSSNQTKSYIALQDNRAAGWTNFYLDNLMTYNLTTPMGAGNTTTATEMADILTQSGETYWDGAKTLLCNPSNKYFDFDYSGNNRPLKMYNFAYTTASGWNGNYLVLDGTDDYLRRVLSAAIADGTAYSAGLVFNIAANKTAMSLHTGSTVAMILGLDASGYVTATTYKTDGTAYTATGNVSYAGKNVMATVVMDTASNLLSLYVNGSFVASAAAAATVRGFSTVSVGRNAADSAYTALSKGMNFLNTKALTGSEVAGYYHGNKKFFGI